MADELLTASAYAARRGVSAMAISKAIKSGRIKKALVRAGKRYKIDPSIADKELDDNTDTAQVRTDAAGGNHAVSYSQSRAVREAYQAKLAKLEYEEKAGKLVEAEKVRMEAFKIARSMRDALLSLPDRVAPKLRACQNDYHANSLLREEILDILNKFLNY